MRLIMAIIGLGLVVAGASAQVPMNLPQPSAEGISRGQPFDSAVPDPSIYAGHVYFIWGAKAAKNPAPAVGSKYLPYARDYNRKHTLEWYKANHPDWIVYKEDRSTPAYGFTYAHGNPMPLDITNPAVRAFYYDTYVAPFVAQGYPMFAFDNVNIRNWDHRSGHFDAQDKWVQQFSGEKIDAAYVASVLDWMQYLTARLHAAGVGVAANIGFPLGRPELFPAMLKLVNMVDLWGDEQGFTMHHDSDITDARWQQKFDFIRRIAATKDYWAINEMSTKHLADASPSQIDYAVANYYLYREKDSMLTVCGLQEYDAYLDTPAMDVDLGHAIGAPIHDSGGAWTRAYSKGFVAVNPSSKQAATVKLGPGTWIDSHGKEYWGKIEVPSNSGVMLILKKVSKGR